MRYRRCVLPRFDPLRTERGLRDEVDVIAARENVILVIECKPLMSDSLQVLNHLGESDYDKLKRLAATHTPARLSALLRQATGSRYLPAVPSVELALAVSDIDVAAPDDIAVFVVDDGVTLIQP